MTKSSARLNKAVGPCPVLRTLFVRPRAKGRRSRRRAWAPGEAARVARRSRLSRRPSPLKTLSTRSGAAKSRSVSAREGQRRARQGWGQQRHRSACHAFPPPPLPQPMPPFPLPSTPDYPICARAGLVLLLPKALFVQNAPCTRCKGEGN
eukprot:6200611-Pleurochrysis_carterae.AAC.1